MPLRRPSALTTAAVALATVGLSSCGFDPATNREQASAVVGIEERDGVIDVLGAVVVSTEPGSGTLIASFANNSRDEEASLTEVAVVEGEAPQPAEFEPIVIGPGSLVNLADPAANIKVTGDFEAGDFVEMAITFDNGETVQTEVPVVENGGYYADLDGPAPVEETHEGDESGSEH